MPEHVDQSTSIRQINQLVKDKKSQTNRSIPQLIEVSIRNGEGFLSKDGAIVVATGKFTGRSPNDRYITDHEEYHHLIDWGVVNRPISVDATNNILGRMVAYLQSNHYFINELSAGALYPHQIPLLVITEYAWHSIFSSHLFRSKLCKVSESARQLTIICAPGFHANPESDGTNSQVFIILDFKLGLVLIGGTSYAGEIKKAVFTYLNYLSPQENVFPMHCAANVGSNGKSALFFGLSGTGKTTLSSDSERILVGDDEHGWSQNGVFNFEGGCYAKTIRLNKTREPLIWNAVNCFGTVLENVNLDMETRLIDYSNDSLTENTRAAYPISYIDNSTPSGIAEHPEHIFFLTADAYGVLPPIAWLSQEQIVEYYLLGYTSKIAGTERGLGVEPRMTFSFGFGAPFLPQKPEIYIRLLLNRIKQHKTSVWLVNTGWVGGNYGTGKRISLPITRQLINMVVNNQLNEGEFIRENYFGLSIPKYVRGISQSILNPAMLWNNLIEYETTAARLKTQIDQQLLHYSPLLIRSISGSI